jgi:transglutaminase-like putative cysteine protease
LPTLLFKFLLRSDLPVMILVPAVLAVTALGILRRLTAGPWLRFLSYGLIPVIAVSVLIGLLITPDTEYLLWKDMLRVGAQRGAVSTLWTMIAALLSSVIAPMVLTWGVLWPILLLGFLLTALISLMFQNPLFFYPVVGFAALCLFYQAVAGRLQTNPAVSAGEPVAAVRGRSGAAIYALTVFVLVLVVVGAGSSRKDPRQIEFVNSRVHPALRRGVIRLFPRFPLLYGISDYGYSYDQATLGTPPSLSRRPIFQVTGPPGETLYLRTATYDSYDGSSWQRSENTGFEAEESLRPQIFDRSTGGPTDVDITLRIEVYRRLPHTIDTIGVRFPERRAPVAAGSFREGVRLDPPLIYGDTVQLRLGESLYRQTAARDGGTSGDRSRAQRYLRPYLKVPASVPREVRALARQLSAPADTDEILRNIDRHLTVNYTYTLNPQRMAGEEDFVNGFLFGTGEGFCVHFASSFIVLARLNGIPARYVTGFMAILPDDGSPGIVTGQHAHAWPEVWIDGEGWVPWEATRPLDRDSYVPLGEDLAYEFDIELDRETSRQLRTVLGDDVRSGFEDSAGYSGLGVARSSPVPAWILMAAVVSPGLLAGIWLLRKQDRRRRLRQAVRFGPQGRFHRRTRRLVRKIRRLGIPPPTAAGWLEWGDEVGRRFPQAADSVREYCDLLCAHLYGAQKLDPSWMQSWRRIRKVVA